MIIERKKVLENYSETTVFCEASLLLPVDANHLCSVTRRKLWDESEKNSQKILSTKYKILNSKPNGRK